MGLSPEILAGAERVSAKAWNSVTEAVRGSTSDINLLTAVGESRYTAKLGELAGRVEQKSVSLTHTPMYEIYRPEGSSGEHALIVLQGASFNGRLLPPVNMPAETGLNKLADERGMSIIYPIPVTRPIAHGPLKGVNGLSWNVPGVRNMADPTYGNYNDMERLDWMLHDAVNRFHLNPDTLTMAGMSDGGRLMNRYMGERLGSIKAGVSVHGTVLGDEVKLAPDLFRPAVMIVHSTPGEGILNKDLMVPWKGGIGGASGNFMWGGMFAPLKDSAPADQVAYWLRNPSLPIEFTRDGNVSHSTWNNGGVPLEQYLIKGAQHAWHGTLGKGGLPIIGSRYKEFETSQHAVDFLIRNRTNNGGLNVARALSVA